MDCKAIHWTPLEKSSLVCVAHPAEVQGVPTHTPRCLDPFPNIIRHTWMNIEQVLALYSRIFSQEHIPPPSASPYRPSRAAVSTTQFFQWETMVRVGIGCAPLVILFLAANSSFAARQRPLRPNYTGFAWAITVGLDLMERGIPSDMTVATVSQFQEVLDRWRSDLPRIPRSCSLVEMCAGSAGISRRVQSHGLHSLSVEKDDFAWQDLSTPVGTLYFRFAAAVMLGLRR